MKIVCYKLSTTKELITPRSGIICLAELIEKIGIAPMIDNAGRKLKSNNAIKHSEYILSYIFALHAGADNLSDLSILTKDKGLMQILGFARSPTASAFGKWLKKNSKSLMVDKLLSYLVELSLGNCKKVTLDIDATYILSFNKEALYGYIGKGYMPMIGTIAETSQIIAIDFREGNVAPSKDNHQFIKDCKSNLPKGIELGGVRIDAAGYQHEIIDWLIDEKIDFAIRAKMHKALRQQVLDNDEWDNDKIRILHTMQDSKHSFELVIQRTLVDEGQLELGISDETSESISCGKYIYRAIATNSKKNNDDLVNWYNQRADDSENRIKDLKLDFGADKMPCKDFDANSLYINICALSYNIFQVFKLVLPQEYNNSRLKKVSTFVYHNAAKIISHARQLVVKVQESAINVVTATIENIKKFEFKQHFLK
jgi:hypothetical protein